MAKYLTKQNMATAVSLLLLVLQTIGAVPTAAGVPQPVPTTSAPCPALDLLDAGAP